MSTETNKELVRQFVADVLDGQDIAAADKYLSPNFLHHDQAPGELTRNQTGLAGQKAFLNDVVFKAFSGFETGFEDLVAEGDLVAGRWRQSSRNTGSWLGQPASGRTARIAGISILRIKDDLIIEEWEARDAIGLFTQLGIPTPRLRLGRLQPLNIRPPRPTVRSPFLTNGPFFGVRDPFRGKAPRALAGRYLVDGWSRGDPDVLGTVLASDYRLHDPSGLLPKDSTGPESLVRNFHQGMPDLSLTVDLQLTEGDRVVSRWTARGTHRGEMFGLPPTGRRAAVTGINVVQVGGDEIHEEWVLWEQLSLLQQLGAVS